MTTAKTSKTNTFYTGAPPPDFNYRWNERNQLTESHDGAYSVYYRYGEDGERAVKYNATNGEETLYFNSMWQMRNGEAQWVQSKHIYVGETRIGTKYNSEGNENTGAEKERVYYYHSDHLGSAQVVTNHAGQLYERLEYTPYGETWIEWRNAGVQQGEATPYRFTGKERDEETGLYYYGARYLDPKTSRWLSADPAMGEYLPGAPVSDEARRRNGNLPGMGGIFNLVNLHVYHYAGNNPVKYVDPDGRASILTRLINRGSHWYYNSANELGRKTEFKLFLHSLVDMDDLSSVLNVYQYSGPGSGFTRSDTYSAEKEYTIVYSGMDDALTEQAAKNVLSLERFGANDNDKAKELYKIFINDCNDFTNAIIKEYEKLWKVDYRSKNENASKRDTNNAWKSHFNAIKQEQGEKVEINE
jgi:RHS repeat-associated protein